ncbi:MAG: hypothetical protein ACRC78_03055 [Planktothrix sp.]
MKPEIRKIESLGKPPDQKPKTEDFGVEEALILIKNAITDLPKETKIVDGQISFTPETMRLFILIALIISGKNIQKINVGQLKESIELGLLAISK